jgi:hypothetical protein
MIIAADFSLVANILIIATKLYEYGYNLHINITLTIITMTITNFIVCHNLDSFKYFINNNKKIADKFIYITVGEDKEEISEIVSYNLNKRLYYKIAIPCLFLENIEIYKTLLSFTAWYYLSENELVESEYIGIFEYDTIFKENPGDNKFIFNQISPNSLIGFNRHELPNPLFLDLVPEFAKLLTNEEKKKALAMSYFSASSNLIMSLKFLHDFVNWYMQFIPKILDIPNHPHFHERAINVFAANNNYKIIISNIAEHQNLNSHKINLV